MYAVQFMCKHVADNTCCISKVWELESFQTAQVTSRSLKVLLPFDRPHDLLLVFHCNYDSILQTGHMTLNKPSLG